MNKSNKPATEVLVNPEQFALMTSDEIVQFIKKNPNTAINGSTPGLDRHIIRYADHKAWCNYKNPYSIN